MSDCGRERAVGGMSEPRFSVVRMEWVGMDCWDVPVRSRRIMDFLFLDVWIYPWRRSPDLREMDERENPSLTWSCGQRTSVVILS